MIHEILPVGPLQCNCSIFGDETTREAVVIDPGDEIERIVSILDRHGLTVKWIVITHAHIDHIGGAGKLRARTGAPVYMNDNDLSWIDMLDTQAAWLGMPTPGGIEVDSRLNDGESIDLNGATFHVLHTPGHTQGSVSLLIPSENKLVAGDTLFRDSIGRTDLHGGNHRQLLGSIKTKLLPLADDVQVVCGHGPGTTIGRERTWNMFLRGL
ncbi:MAG: MBL fold metallo-hydrolase [Bryobacterales bacterium]|nr:MBL fold metallo-hydrolase [Bryobacterales bacterium]